MNKNKTVKMALRVLAVILLAIINLVEFLIEALKIGWDLSKDVIKWVVTNPWTCVREVIKLTLATAMGMLALYWVFSFKWSIDDMSKAEKIIAMTYFILMIPMYLGIKEIGRWFLDGIINKK